MEIHQFFWGKCIDSFIGRISKPAMLEKQPEVFQMLCLDVPNPGSERINGDRINGLVISPTYK